MNKMIQLFTGYKLLLSKYS